MKQTICEFMMWNGLPVIRREIAMSMINDYGLSQKETAEKLGVTPAAVCQYVSKKRGRLDITDENILFEINKSAQTIIINGNNDMTSETCRICKMLRQTNAFIQTFQSCNTE